MNLNDRIWKSTFIKYGYYLHFHKYFSNFSLIFEIMITSSSSAFSSLQPPDIFVLNAVMANLHCQLAYQGKGNLNWRIASIRWPVGMAVGHFLDGKLMQESSTLVVMPSLGRWAKLIGRLWTSQPSRKHCSSLVSASVSASNPHSGFSQWWFEGRKPFLPTVVLASVLSRPNQNKAY